MAPSFEELSAERAREWAEAQAIAAKQHEALQDRLSRMRDVREAPDPDVAWSHPRITCVCGSKTFLCSRWVTINGARYRAELECLECQRVATWDWGERRWIG